MNAISKVSFYGNKIPVVEKDGIPYVSMKPIVDALGLAWKNQYEIIRRDPVLSSTILVTGMVAEDDKTREMVCLPLSYLNGWLFKIPATRYTGCRREAILKYQRECYQALYRHFHKDQPCSDNMRKIIESITAEAARKENTISALKIQVLRLLELLGVATSEPFVEEHRRCTCKGARPASRAEFFQMLRELLPNEAPIK